MPFPCCHVPLPAGVFYASLHNDAQRFSQCVAGITPVPLAAHYELTSALQVDMKLWPAAPLHAPPYTLNNALNNALRAARPLMTRNLPHQQLLPLVCFPANRPHNTCAFPFYDDWVLTNICVIRGQAIAQVPAPEPITSFELTTVGKAAKFRNVLVKHITSWHVTGVWPAVNPFPLPAWDPLDCCCALHAPIDNQMLRGLLLLSVGRRLVNRGMLKRGGQGVLIRQGLGPSPFVFWSRIDCLRVYFGIQLILRRIAQATWPNGCACAAYDYDRWFKDWCYRHPAGEFAIPLIDGDRDWIDEAVNIPQDEIAASARELMQGRADPNDTHP